MKLGNVLFLFLSLFIIVSGLSVVSGGECGVTPTDNCNISVSTTFNNGVYYLNGSTSGAIAIFMVVSIIIVYSLCII